ncbi:STAS/SEC14 domain-containing protein [Roseovarius sp. MMSF_3281]|uniref:STAS/SEC14 domain-containing protein n=1 Tax=Roseovarius sp. MMSF_3281 TaxID=3046694 RepID=UPI00273F61D4|nr:STAS/SEC14 domain-containing protein [Roseovarius sp. MMSF_3281]
MTIQYSEDPETRTVEIIVADRITQEDYDAVAERMQTFIDTHGTIRLIEVIENFQGFDPTMIWSGIKFDMKNLRHISHVAVVSDIGWIGPLSKAAGALLTTKLRTFDTAEVEAAREWIITAE